MLSLFPGRVSLSSSRGNSSKPDVARTPLQATASRHLLPAGSHLSLSPAPGQAMIATPTTVRNITRCLIALYRHRHARNPLDTFVFPSLQENKSTLGASISAGTMPQTRGKKSAKMRFDICGLIDWLRCRYPRSTSVNVEADTGIPAATIDNWLQGRSTPSVSHFSELLAVYGPPLLEASFTRPSSWVTEAARVFKRAELSATIMRLQAELGDA